MVKWLLRYKYQDILTILMLTLTVLTSVFVMLNSVTVPFIPERVKVVDKIGSNYLLRGNLPIKNDKFALTDLKKQIQKVTGIASSKQDLVVYSLINHYTDSQSHNAIIEQEFFNTHPKDGKLYFYPILGFWFSPGLLPNFMLNLAASYYQTMSYDKLDTFLDLLKKETGTGRNKVVYFHCTHGLDRTGLVSAAYKMKFKGQTYQNVMDENRQIAKRDLKWTIVNGINWFCQGLKISNPKVQCTMNDGTRGTEEPEL